MTPYRRREAATRTFTDIMEEEQQRLRSKQDKFKDLLREVIPEEKEQLRYLEQYGFIPVSKPGRERIPREWSECYDAEVIAENPYIPLINSDERGRDILVAGEVVGAKWHTNDPMPLIRCCMYTGPVTKDYLMSFKVFYITGVFAAMDFSVDGNDPSMLMSLLSERSIHKIVQNYKYKNTKYMDLVKQRAGMFTSEFASVAAI